jgi:hypothetical protein
MEEGGDKMRIEKCLWCGRGFEWDNTMYQFCTPCLDNIEIVQRITETKPHILDKLEMELKKEEK